ncbi:plant intracellular Ras-group-related LRR protein 6-like [Impatiens glandulifera]|uniref:plant intracellular Ras-group-related LRR protein 6-like n=1 Tax=Impatiens glandulifera TaxID=253017 RepID=UPI001FB061C8|nr:plant intracellular Ras-group-related LRR protein 6-like [Impatiens glandulifera]
MGVDIVYEQVQYEHHHQQMNGSLLMKKKEKKIRAKNMYKWSSFSSDMDQEKLMIHHEIVDLSSMSMNTFPTTLNFHLINNNIINMAAISKLDLSNNNLQEIPESVTARLLNLTELDIRSNELKSLPNSIGCLSKLKILNISCNLISSFPKTIENCKSLEELTANFNLLNKLPDTIGFELTKLKKLSINSNKLIFLPYSTCHLTNLRLLDARLNHLHSLPDDLENLVNLEILNVSQNFQYLQTLPYSIGLLLSLKELDVSYNNITQLPDSIACIKKLQRLSVEGNPLVSPPMNVCEKGLHEVQQYLGQKMYNKGSCSTMNKKKAWLVKLARWSTFNGACVASKFSDQEYRREGGWRLSNISSPSRSVGDSPTFFGMSSPLHMLSPRKYFKRS